MLMSLAVEGGLIRSVSPQRLGAEIRKILAEEQVLPMLRMLTDFGLLQAIHRALGEMDWALLRGLPAALGVFDPEPWICLYSGDLVSPAFGGGHGGG